MKIKVATRTENSDSVQLAGHWTDTANTGKKRLVELANLIWQFETIHLISIRLKKLTSLLTCQALWDCCATALRKVWSAPECISRGIIRIMRNELAAKPIWTIYLVYRNSEKIKQPQGLQGNTASALATPPKHASKRSFEVQAIVNTCLRIAAHSCKVSTYGVL